MATDTFHTAALAQVPLAEASLRLLDYVLDDKGLADLFEAHRGAAYNRKLVFPDFVRLIADCLLGSRGSSAHRTFQTLREGDQDAASVQAAYKKLGRLPMAVSLALFDHANARLDQLAIHSQPLRDTPKSLADFRLLAFDGKTIKYIARKLKPLRGLGGGFCGGKLLVAADVVTGCAVGVEAALDGEASDVPLAVPLIQRIRAASTDPRPRLWIGDRIFCSTKPLIAAAAEGDDFVIRQHSLFHFHPEPGAATRTGVDDKGRVFSDQIGTLGDGAHAIRVRRIAVTRKKAKGRTQADFVLVTSLTDADRYPAVDILAVYRLRWPIETLFQEAVQTFQLRHLIGGSPHATIFQAVLALLLSNITHAVRDAAAEAIADDIKPVDLSLARLFDDTRRELVGLFLMVDPDDVTAALQEKPLVTPAALRKHLRKLLHELPPDRYRKAPTRKNTQKPKNRGYVCGGHTSVHKALQGVIKIVPIKGAKTKPCYAKKKDDKDV